jgi:hypothetical protein
MVLRRVVALAVLAVLVTASPAAADPARPTDYRSRIDGIEPEVEGVHAEIIGGDAFIQLTVDPGRIVVVQGYYGEPYLQFLPDGTVQENQLSPATFLNASRYGREGEVDMPADVAARETLDDPPEWRTVATNGQHAWHDHRVHWMSPDKPPGFSPGDVLQTQDVDLTVDGQPVAITVSVLLEDSVSPLPWLGLGVVLLGVVAAIGWRKRALAVSVVAAIGASILAIVAGEGELSAVPAGAGGSALVVIVPVVALVAALAAGLLLWRGRQGLAGVALLGSAAALGGWALLRLAVLFKPVLPTELPAGYDRTATAVAIGVAAAVAILTFHSGAVAPAPLTDEDDE